MKYAQVVVNTPLGITKPREEEGLVADSLRERAFTYSIPVRLADQIELGQLVWVPFGARRLQGVIVDLSETSPIEETKDIDEIVDPRPFLSVAHINLARWIARTYVGTLNDALQLMLPPGIEQQTEILVTLAPDASRDNLTPKQAALVDRLARDGETKMRRLPRELRASVAPLVRRGIVVKRTRLAAPRAKPKRVKSVRLIGDVATIDAALARLAPRNPQADALEYLARRENVLPTVKELGAAVPCKKNALAALSSKGWIEMADAQELISLSAKYFADLPVLAQAQSRALVYLRERGVPVPLAELKTAVKANALILRALESKGYLERTRLEPTVLLKLGPHEAVIKAHELRGMERYAAIVDFLRGENKPVWISALYAATGCTRTQLQKLEASGVIALEEEEVWRDSLAGRVFDVVEPPKLTGEQEAAWGEIREVLSVKREAQNAKRDRFLLHGVTGSGKTEIYLRALSEILAQGKQGIVLVPEISLTPQTIRRFGARFPNRIAVLHSRLSDGERYDTWRRCRDGKVDVVIGSRSALFAPLPRLGLIVIDEEHDPAYKQESLPHYHAREAALELARRVGATVVLGSATPDVETYHRATRGEFKLLELPQRIMGHRGVIENEISRFEIRGSKLAIREVGTSYADARYLELPPVEIVDLRAELKAGNRSMFSRALQREMARVLAAREQVILFLNRRGTATFILCRDCGNVFKCKRCDNPMTYHGVGDQLVCHHCNRRDRVPLKCPNCGSARIRYFGIGTEKVETEIQAMFPNARTLRWDFDVTRGKESHEAILEKFVRHQADVLIGTQMIAKGLDMPLVTLVGVISADTSLNLPDFRAGERTFQLLTQVAGRAGRSILGGKVIIQTYNPEHYAIVAASAHDYRAFYEHEMAFRREQDYPPFNRLIRLLYAHASEKRAQEESARLHRTLATRIAQRGLPALDLIGPAPAFFHRMRGEYRYQILLCGSNPHALVQDIALPLGWRVDVDPVSVL
jgi:primosomal protein N' (replication factor Y)